MIFGNENVLNIDGTDYYEGDALWQELDSFLTKAFNKTDFGENQVEIDEIIETAFDKALDFLRENLKNEIRKHVSTRV